MSDRAPMFVLVGHCGPDMHMLRSAVIRAVPGAAVVFARNDNELKPHLNDGAILLVNRVLDGDFDEEGGIALIRRALVESGSTRALLISNLPEAQEEAAKAGALPGFGKTQLYDAATVEKLRRAAGVT